MQGGDVMEIGETWCDYRLPAPTQLLVAAVVASLPLSTCLVHYYYGEPPHIKTDSRVNSLTLTRSSQSSKYQSLCHRLDLMSWGHIRL
jgi:hypothetical protein